MKVENRKTGEIGTLIVDGAYNFVTNFAVEDDERNRLGEYNSLAELNKWWTDYEEPKSGIKDVWFPDVVEGRNNVVISFETREEAELAVCKLKAWKRLKELGFRFIDWELDMETIADGKIWFDIGVNTEWNAEQLLELKPEAKKSLDILFGGEE